MTDRIELQIAGQRYGGWLAASVQRRIDHMVTTFDCEVSEHWPGLDQGGQDEPWAIRKFDPCVVLVGGERVLTGYVDTYTARIDARTHRVGITGGSRTMDLADCAPDLPSGQFRGYPFPAIARAVAAPFGIEVVDEIGDEVEPMADTMMDRAETAYEFLERLARLSGVLMTDDPQGRLVLTRTGTLRAHDSLVLGRNILSAGAELSGRRQFSSYTVKAQKGLQQFAPSGDQATVLTGQQGVATDPSVPRHRPHVALAESQLSQAQLDARARWMARYAAARSTRCDVTVQGWRQSDGTLWAINRLVSVNIPPLHLDQDLLVAEVAFGVSPQGSVTHLTLGPPEGYTPDPAQVRLRKPRHSRKNGRAPIDWSGAGGIQ